jgi:hypothetical protein
MGQEIRPGRYQRACGPEDIAPTLARLLGLDYRREPDSRLLLEMLRQTDQKGAITGDKR